MLLDLPSSASAVDFADNTNNSFKVRLPQKLVLEPGEWEVGALVAHIPNKFYNIVAGGVTLQSPRDKQTYNVTPGFYRTPDSLVAEIKKQHDSGGLSHGVCFHLYQWGTTRQQTRSK